MERLKSRQAELGCATLLCLMALNLIGQILRKSIAADEIVLVPAAYLGALSPPNRPAVERVNGFDAYPPPVPPSRL